VEVGAVGPQRKKVTLPVGVGGVPAALIPWTTAVSVTGVPGVTVPPAPGLGDVVNVAEQFAMVKSPGPTRSFICAEPELPELRLTAYTLPKLLQAPGGKTPAFVRSIPASPNSTSPSVSSTEAVAGGAGGAKASTAVAEKLTAASAVPAANVLAGPQHGAELLLTSQAPLSTHRRSVSVGGFEPPSKSYTISRSPAERLTSPSAAAGQAPEVALLNSKPICADALVEFCGIRTQASIKNTCPLAPVELAT
jgi:hypothetical protein